MTYAEVFDVEAGFRALSKDEQTRCAALLSEDDSTGGVSFPMGSTQGTATALGYSQSWTMSGGSSGELYLSKLEKKLLGVGSRVGARSPLEDLC